MAETNQDGITRKERVRRQTVAFSVVFVIVSIVALLPLFRTRILPLLDEPNHLSETYIFHHYNDAWANLREFYDVHVPPVPYLAYHLLVHFIAYVTGIEIANKIVVAAYVLSLPVAALLWTARTGRSPWLSLLVVPLAYNTSFSLGFHPFNVGISIFLFCSVALDAYLEKPTRARGVALFLLALLGDFGHPLGVLAFAVSAPVLMLAHRPAWPRLFRAVGLLSPAALLFAWQVLWPRVSWVKPKGSGPTFEAFYQTNEAMIQDFQEYALDPVSGDFDKTIFHVLLAVTGVLLALDVVMSWGEPRRTFREWLFRQRAGLLAAAMLFLYFAVPFQLVRPFAWWFVGTRYAALVCFFVLLLPSGKPNGIRAVLLAMGIAAAIALPVHVSEKYAQFDARVRPFVRMVERAPRGTNVLLLRFGPRTDPAVNWTVFDQFAAWVQIMHGGYSAAGWTETAHLFTPKRVLPTPPYWQHELFDPDKHAGPYHYIIVHNETEPLFDGDGFRRIDAEGAWTMYERIGETVGGSVPWPPPLSE